MMQHLHRVTRELVVDNMNASIIIKGLKGMGTMALDRIDKKAKDFTTTTQEPAKAMNSATNPVSAMISHASSVAAPSTETQKNDMNASNIKNSNINNTKIFTKIRGDNTVVSTTQITKSIRQGVNLRAAVTPLMRYQE